MIIFVLLFSLILFGLGWIITNKFWLPDLVEDFIGVFFSTLFCSILIVVQYDRIIKLPRFIFFIVFGLLACLGVLMGASVANLICFGQLEINTKTVLLYIFIGVLTSAVITIYEVQKLKLEEKMVHLRTVELENEQLKRLELESRLNILKAKLNPHFLFNTLNSTAALIYENPKRAEESIVMLADLYRKILSYSDKTFIQISEEIMLIKDYLKLEKLRFSEKLSYNTFCPDELKNYKIPCLLIEPLVENSVKHTHKTSNDKINIELKISQNDNNLFITVSDNGPGFEVDKVNYRFGISSIQERLRLVFGNNYKFDIYSKKGKGTKINIRIPI